MTELELKAKWFAIGAHGDQKRKYTGEPYWTHCREVVSILRQFGHTDEYILAAAWLHDVVEDTTFTLKDIYDYFGEQIAQTVSYLTEPPLEYGNREKRKTAYNFMLFAGGGFAQTIKCADLISNTSTIVKYDKKFAKVYLKEKRETLKSLSMADDRLLARAYEVLEAAEAELNG